MTLSVVYVSGNDFMNGGGLFEDAPLPVGEVSMPAPVEAQKPEGNVMCNGTSCTDLLQFHNHCVVMPTNLYLLSLDYERIWSFISF